MQSTDKQHKRTWVVSAEIGSTCCWQLSAAWMASCMKQGNPSAARLYRPPSHSLQTSSRHCLVAIRQVKLRHQDSLPPGNRYRSTPPVEVPSHPPPPPACLLGPLFIPFIPPSPRRCSPQQLQGMLWQHCDVRYTTQPAFFPCPTLFSYTTWHAGCH